MTVFWSIKPTFLGIWGFSPSADLLAASVLGTLINCLSGRSAVYLKSAIIKLTFPNIMKKTVVFKDGDVIISDLKRLTGCYFVFGLPGAVSKRGQHWTLQEKQNFV